MEQIYKLKITLKYIKPPIWRRILVKSNILLHDLHKIIQTTMGWTNSHLHQFAHNRNFYSSPDFNEFDELGLIDYSKIRLNKLLTTEKHQMIYEYDFGDGWEHAIVLEKILSIDPDVKYPLCLDGKRNCPPEDCGGPGGYEKLLNTIKNPEDEEYESMIEWLGKGFDPEEFDKGEINEMLKEKNFGIF
jgi:hypothetical protein